MKKKKIDFDLDLIIGMIDDGFMLKDVAEYYGCTRYQLNWFTRKHGLNFRNNKNARINQSTLMRGEMNPTRGRIRTPEEMRGIAKSNRERADRAWDNRFSDGITFKQYSKICRYIVPKDIQDQAKFGEWEVDHLFSVRDCWENKIHPRYASDRGNLRVIPAYKNREKSSSSSVTLSEFMSMVGVQRLSKAQFNWKRVE